MLVHLDRKNTLFYIGCFIVIFFHCLGLSSLGNNEDALDLFQYCQYIGYALLALRVILFSQYWSAKFALLFVLSIGISIASFFFCGSLTILLLVVFCFAAINMSFKDVCKAVLFALTSGISFVVFLYAIGIIDGRVINATNPLTGEVVSRNALGFRHQNYLGKLALAAFAAYWYLRFDRLKFYDFIFTLVVFFVLYVVVNTKTTSILLLFALLVTVILKRPRGQMWRYVILGIFIVLQLAEVIAVFAFDPSNSWLKTANSLMSTRLSAAHTMVQTYLITPFGQEVEIISSIEALRAGISSSTLDICFFNILLNNGLITLALAIAAWAALIKASLDKISPALFLVSILVLYSGLFESWCVSLPACFMLAALACRENYFPVSNTIK